MEVDLSAILDPFVSHQFVLCPQAMSFFQRLCPAPFPPVSERLLRWQPTLLEESFREAKLPFLLSFSLVNGELL